MTYISALGLHIYVASSTSSNKTMTSYFLVILLAASVATYPREKPGNCIRRVFTAQACEPYETVDKCGGDDFRCPGTQKCCRTGRCVTSCEEPAAPKPGECPHPSRVEPGNLSHCEEDTDCGTGNNRKCCKNENGNTRCAAPRGTCPDTRGIFGPCVVTERNCFSDAKCSPPAICCSYGCGRECLSPVY